MPGAIIRNPTPDWLKPENASVFDSYWKQIARKVGHLIGADDPAAQAMTPLMTEASAAGTTLSGAAQAVVDAAKELPGAQRLATWIRGFHGSPHDFPPVEGAPLGRFDSAKIGTGEGAQAYGHGHYIAEREGVAQGYRDALAGDAVLMPTGEKQSWGPHTAEGRAQWLLNAFAGADESRSLATTYQMARRDLQDEIARGVGYNTGRLAKNKEALALLDQWETAGVRPVRGGKMYEVQIKADPAHFLDWDAPLSAQSEQVQAVVADQFRNVQPVQVKPGWYSVTRVGPNGVGTTMTSAILESSPEAAMQRYGEYMASETGGSLYRRLTESPTLPDEASFNLGPKGAARRLHEAGVPGIKYLDQGSRPVVPVAELEARIADLQNLRAAHPHDPAMARDVALEIADFERRIAEAKAQPQTRNYVVFDDKLIDILRKYGFLPPVAGLGYLSQVGQAQKPEPR